MSLELHSSASHLRLVRVGLMTLGPEQVVLSADGAACALLGLEGDQQAIGRKLTEFIPPAEAEDVEAARREPPFSYLGLASSSRAPLLVHVGPLGEAGALTASVTSINEYLAESHALARVQLRNTIQSIISGFAHEVRNPLAAILSLTEAAMLDDPSPESVLVPIPGLIARVEALLRQSLTYGKPSPPKRSLHQTSFLLDRVITLLRKRESGPRLELPPDDAKIAPVMVDLLQCEQVLINLLDNALDAASSLVKVTVSAGRTPTPTVCIEVADDGPGISEEIAGRIFEPFFTTKARGTGLGLAIARDLARLNGGDLRHVARPRPGATFRLYLPSTNAPVRGGW